MSTRQIFVTAKPGAPSYELMLHGLAQIGSTLFIVGAFTFALIAVLILSLAAIPGRVRRRKR